MSIPEEFEKVKERIYSGGYSNLQVVADFDRTLTKAYVDGEKVPSLISLLRKNNYLGEEYSEKAKELFERFHPVEVSEEYSLEEKKNYMHQWWGEHYDYLKGLLDKKTLDKLVEDGDFEFRDGALDFMDYLNGFRVPMVILSSSGIGNVIEKFLEKRGRNYDNIYVVSNFVEFGEDGYMTGIKGGIIHPFNKGEVALEDFPKAYGAVQGRKNVLLLGDSVGDKDMAEGFEYENILKFGFLNDNVDASLEKYKENFDVVLTYDASMSYVNDFLRGFDSVS